MFMKGFGIYLIEEDLVGHFHVVFETHLTGKYINDILGRLLSEM